MRMNSVALVLLLCGSCMTQVIAAPMDVTDLRDAIRHPTFGCGGAVVLTPRPDTQFASPVMYAPNGPKPFFDEAAEKKATWVTTMDCSGTGRTHAFVPGVAPDGAVQNSANSGLFSSNWSGWELTHTAQYTQAGWTAPTAAKPPLGAYNPTPTQYWSSTWAGIGGSSSTNLPLLQSGTEHDITSAGAASYYFWYEIYGGSTDTGGEIRVNSLSIAPGNSVANVALWDSVTHNAQLGICNYSLSGTQCLTFVIPNTPAPGSSVEWIVEAPSLGSQVQDLTNYGNVSFNNACWVQNFVVGGNNTCSPIGTSGVSISLSQYVYSHYQVVSSPGVITNGSQSSAFAASYIPPERIN